MSRRSIESLSGGTPIKKKVSTSSTHDFTRAKFQIGSCRGDRIHYPKNESVFHISDIPEKARLAKEYVLQSKRKDILQVRRKLWNSTTTRNQNERCFNSSNQQKANDPPLQGMKYNFRAEVLPRKNLKFRPKASKFELDQSLFDSVAKQPQRQHWGGEMPNHPKLLKKTIWNNCVSFTETEKRKQMELFEKHRKRRTIKNNKQMSRQKQYLSPQQQFRKLQKVRRENLVANSLKQQTIVRDKWGAPITQRVSTPNSQEDDFSYKPRKFTPSISRKFKNYSHSGVWEYNEVCQKWIDTGSEIKQSKGDIVTIVDPDAYNFSSPFS
eukprot:GSMAST32.ASY1.ANO1.2387.1 assembled CDS